jgi:hypothetical protein
MVHPRCDKHLAGRKKQLPVSSASALSERLRAGSGWPRAGTIPRFECDQGTDRSLRAQIPLFHVAFPLLLAAAISLDFKWQI